MIIISYYIMINTIIYSNRSAFQAFVQGRGQLRFAQRSELPEAGMRMCFYHVLPCFTRILKHKHQAWWKSKLQTTTRPEMTRATQYGFMDSTETHDGQGPCVSGAWMDATQYANVQSVAEETCYEKGETSIFQPPPIRYLPQSQTHGFVHRHFKQGSLDIFGGAQGWSFIQLYPASGWGPALTPAFCFTLFYIVHSLLVAHSWNAELHWLSSLHLLGYSSCKCVGDSRSRFPDAVALCCCSICCGGAANFHLDDVKICQMSLRRRWRWANWSNKLSSDLWFWAWKSNSTTEPLHVP